MKAFVFALLLIATPGQALRGTHESVLIQDTGVGDNCRTLAFGHDVCQKRT